MNQSTSNRHSRPFGATPDTRFYFPHESIQAALETTVRALVRAEGPVAVLGAPGYGKSLLADLVAETLYDRMDVVKLQSARICSRQALLQSILYELQMPYRELSEGELRLSILDRLEPSPETAPEGVLIVVDEAHTLHPKLLDELRLLTNFSRNGQSRVHLILLGSLRLEDTLANPYLDSLNQRLAARCYLQPMNREETKQYVRHQLRLACQAPESIITEGALQAVFSASQGIPRLVNQLMDHALVLVAHHATDSITQEIINESWGKLQQMPTLWSSTSSTSQASSATNTIEFGSLDEDGPAPSSRDEPHFAEPLIDNQHSLDAPESLDASGSSGSLGSSGSSDAWDGLDAWDTVPAATGRGQNFFAAFSVQDLIDDQAHPTASPFTSLPAPASEHASMDAPQRAYDTMSVWENDPPLRAPGASAAGIEAASHWDLETEEKTEELFGSDFDLELSVPNHGSLTKSNFGSAELSAVGNASSSDCAPPPEDYLVRMQNTAESLTQASQLSDTEMIHLDEWSPSQAWSNPSIDNPHWSIHIVADSGSNTIEESIEDIVSQLNFSAFMVEPFSVEQIPLRADSASNQCGVSPDGSLDLPEGIRVNDQQQVLMLHRPVEDSPFSLVNEAYDDDRDLLIVEEQVPLSSQLLSQNLPSEPAQRPSPYNQLFSRLRR